MPNDFLEKTVEQIIYENRSVIHEKGLPRFHSTSFQQVEMPSGKKIDILSYSMQRGVIFADIYELKKEQIDTAAVCQAYNYAHEFRCLVSGFFPIVNVKLVVVGKNYTPVSILGGLDMPIEIYTYEYAMNGIAFTRHSSDPKMFTQSNTFVNALLAFGNGLHFPKGNPKIFNMVHQYMDYLKTKPEYESEIEELRGYYSKPEIKLLPPSTDGYSERISYVPAYDDMEDVTYETNE